MSAAGNGHCIFPTSGGASLESGAGPADFHPGDQRAGAEPTLDGTGRLGNPRVQASPEQTTGNTRAASYHGTGNNRKARKGRDFSELPPAATTALPG